MSPPSVTKSSQRANMGAVTALLVTVGAAFVWISSRTLPERVASHFAASGNATGFLPRSLYLRLTLTLVVGMPLAINVLTSLSLRNDSARINLPNREYWFAPERRCESVDLVRRHIARFGANAA